MHGVTSREAGFTLVEMLVALSIFALLSAAGVGLLRSSVDTQAAVDTKLSDLAAAARLRALLANDLVQVLDRPTRQSGGGEAPAFVGLPAEMRFVRGGWIDPADPARPELLAVRWAVAGGKLERATHKAVDGGNESATAPLARDLTSASFRYRGSNGEWRTSWAPAVADPPLPAAVELIITPTNGRPVMLVVALPPLPAPDPVQVPAGVAS